MLSVGSTRTISCPAGKYNPNPRESCKICNAGFKCPEDGLVNQIPCPEGEYQDEVEALFCKPCPLGYYCSVTNLTSPIVCESGWYASAFGMTNCTKCDYGFEEDTSMPVDEGGIRCKTVPYGNGFY